MSQKIRIEYNNANPNHLGLFAHVFFNIHRKHARFYVFNDGNEEVYDVRGIIELTHVETIASPAYLHWTHTPYNDPEPQPANIPAGEFRILDIVFSQPREGTDITQDLVAQVYLGPPTSGMQNATMGGTIPPELMKYYYDNATILLETYSSMYEAEPEGCFIAHNNALLYPEGFLQYHIPPGEYEGRVRLVGDCMKEIRIPFRLSSPEYWRDLNFTI